MISYELPALTRLEPHRKSSAVEVDFQFLVVMVLMGRERKRALKLNHLWLTSLLNISKLVMFMQSHRMMLPMIAEKVVRGPKAEEAVGMKQYGRCLIVIWQQRVTNFAGSR